MFKGVACFSPQVCSNVRLTWQDNGGTIATCVNHLDSVSFFFATVQDNYWIKSLRSLSVPVYNEAWILDSVQKGDVAFLHHYALSDGLQPEPMEPVICTNETAAPGSQDTLLGDETASDLEVERTLVGDENVHRIVLEKLISQARRFLEQFDPSIKHVDLPEISLDRLLEGFPAALCSISFRAGGDYRGEPFHAKQKTTSGYQDT